jgi:hypothetical protein
VLLIKIKLIYTTISGENHPTIMSCLAILKSGKFCENKSGHQHSCNIKSHIKQCLELSKDEIHSRIISIDPNIKKCCYKFVKGPKIGEICGVQIKKTIGNSYCLKHMGETRTQIVLWVNFRPFSIYILSKEHMEEFYRNIAKMEKILIPDWYNRFQNSNYNYTTIINPKCYELFHGHVNDIKKINITACMLADWIRLSTIFW